VKDWLVSKQNREIQPREQCWLIIVAEGREREWYDGGSVTRARAGDKGDYTRFEAVGGRKGWNGERDYHAG
jgi:hypothetical protein